MGGSDRIELIYRARLKPVDLCTAFVEVSPQYPRPPSFERPCRYLYNRVLRRGFGLG